MARARIIKPEFFRSRSLARVSIPALVTFEGLWAEADAKGRGVAHPLILKGSIWPLRDEITPDIIIDHLNELETTDHIVLYTIDDERYFEVTNWDKHQSAAYRTGDSKHPAPPNRATCTTGRAETTDATPATPSGVGLPAETSNVVQLAQPGVQPARQVVHKGKGREGKKTNTRATHVDFETFWAAYPRREARADAERAFTKARSKVDLEVLLNAITAQRLAAKETRFVPYPASWLNGERWTDEPATSTTRDPRNRDDSIERPDGIQMSGHYR